ncbi:lymphocyte-specific protein 1-like isoform X1 [Hippocampus comes]|uniref:lymphocyte-specific protein 1-like isoform X1 n=1 Tax=Hippocampus comes TaxID=109280 RepID=UPI00094EC208|nr:PREDICTED: lymphocyte-specific protein 1-like isoform X1 [Hippocampus comes]
MSESIRRRSSSRQLLENLIQVTVQRSLEDAEEVERERRRRTRERQREEQTTLSVPHQQNRSTSSGVSDEELHPRGCFVQEEDEGFSDWSHRLHRLENRNDLEHVRAKAQEPSSMQWKAGRNNKKQQDDEEQAEWQPTQRSHALQCTRSPPLGKKEVKLFLSNDPRQQQASDPQADTMLDLATERISKGVCLAKQEEERVQQTLQKEWRSCSGNRATYEVDHEAEDLDVTREEIKKRLSEFEGNQKLTEERSKEEGCRSDDDKIRRAGLSLYSSDEDETLNCYGAMSPTFKKLLIQFYPDEVKSRIPADGKCVITERTESLRKSSNSQKIPQPLCVSKIDKKLQQYTHALEVSTKESKPASPVLVDAMSPIAHKKNLFEAGVAWNQNTLANTPPKEIKPGVVLSKKNVWEGYSDIVSLASSGRDTKECSAGKMYKFVAMAHGKYEKVSDEDGLRDDANWAA